MYINCLREEHTDNNASAIINDGNGTYLKDSVKCMGCGQWYTKDTPESSFGSYKELLFSLGENVKLKSIDSGEILPYSKIKPVSSYYSSKPKKSRENLHGMTIKSNLKSDRKIEVNGKDIYIDKTPKVLDDNQGTHESVKEFFFNEDINERGLVDTNRGFYNRISIDSDDEGEILPRLKKIVEYSSIKGFWFMLNNGNNKLQANINFMHTTLNGHDLSKVREIGRCLNNLIGDENMTNSFMKNHKVHNRNEEGFNMGAQKTRTFGFDIDLQEDYEDLLNGKNWNWINKWAPMIESRKIEVTFVSSITGKEENPSENSICAIRTPVDMEFNIRKDKTWSVSVESLWLNTSIKYAQKKMEDGRIKYTNTEHGSVSQYNMLVFNSVSSMLKDNKKTTYNNKIIENNLKPNVKKYLDYYTNNMIAYNPIVQETIIDRREVREFGLIRDFIDNRKNLRNFISVLRTAMQNGLVSINKEEGLISHWKTMSNNDLNINIKETMNSMRIEEIEIIRNLIPALTQLSVTNVDTLYNGRRIDKMPLEIRPYYSIAIEATYYSRPSMIKGISEKANIALLELSKIDYSAYRNLSISILLTTMMSSQDLFNKRLLHLRKEIEISQNAYSEMMRKSGIRNKVEMGESLDLLRVSLLDQHYSSLTSLRYKCRWSLEGSFKCFSIKRSSDRGISKYMKSIRNKRREKVP